MRRFAALFVGLLVVSVVAPAHANVKPDRFYKALRKRDARKIERYLEKGVARDVVLKGLKGAISRDHLDIVALLARRTEADEEILNDAIRRRAPAAFDSLTDAGWRFRERASLRRAITAGDEDLALRILDAGLGLGGLVPQRGFCQLEENDRGLVLEVCEEEPGTTILALAVQAEMERLVDALLEGGSDPSVIVVAEPGRARGLQGRGRRVGEQELLKDPDQFSASRRSTALAEAVLKRNPAIVDRLLAGGAPIAVGDIDACHRAWTLTLGPSSTGRDIVYRLCPGIEFIDAAEQGDVERLSALHAEGQDVNVTDPRGMTALHLAASKGRVDAVRWLIEKGAAVDARNLERGIPPLYDAVGNYREDVVRLLLGAGADPNGTGAFGGGVLHLAPSVEMARLLIDAGADVNLAANNGFTPLLSASWRGRFALVDLLRSRGATYPDGYPPLEADVDLPVSGSTPKVEALLLDASGGKLRLRGRRGFGALSQIECDLTDIARDARYFHAPPLVRGRRLPAEEPLVTLLDADLEAYEGTFVRIEAQKGRCTWLALPSAKAPESATPEQLAALTESVEVVGNVLEMIATGRGTRVFRGRLVSVRKKVAEVKLDGGLTVRCKLSEKTKGILYGAAIFERALMGQRDLDPGQMMTDEKLRTHVGRRVRVGPGEGRCEYLELLSE